MVAFVEKTLLPLALSCQTSALAAAETPSGRFPLGGRRDESTGLRREEHHFVMGDGMALHVLGQSRPRRAAGCVGLLEVRSLEIAPNPS